MWTGLDRWYGDDDRLSGEDNHSKEVFLLEFFHVSRLLLVVVGLLDLLNAFVSSGVIDKIGTDAMCGYVWIPI